MKLGDELAQITDRATKAKEDSHFSDLVKKLEARCRAQAEKSGKCISINSSDDLFSSVEWLAKRVQVWAQEQNLKFETHYDDHDTFYTISWR